MHYMSHILNSNLDFLKPWELIKEEFEENSLEDGKGGKVNQLLNIPLPRLTEHRKGGKVQDDSFSTINQVVSASLLLHIKEGKDSRGVY